MKDEEEEAHERGAADSDDEKEEAADNDDDVDKLIDDDEPLVNVEMDTAQLKEWIAAGKPFTLVDIREPHELRLGHAARALLLRMNDILELRLPHPAL